MSSRHKRSSILKGRPSVDPGSLEGSPSEATVTTKTIKRIGFKPKKSVKEFFASDETATIWCNSYELSADETPPCLVINDETTLKNASEMEFCLSKTMDKCQSNKENYVVVEDRRNSCSESSVWDLSISAYEDEKRRIKSENSVDSSVLNMTERLIQEPITKTRQVLRQKQDWEAVDDLSAMDISPVKLNGKLNSHKRILYHHPKQNMFVSIDVKNEKQSSQNLDDLEINFFGPKESSAVSENTRASKILFQTTNTPIQLRNKSVQIDLQPSNAGFRSAAGNADFSADWNSHLAVSEHFAQRMTFGSSQFEISEAWNSHPAAALKLKMLQQGLKPAEFDPRLSGGGTNIEDVDTTLAITQTVAKMLGPGSRPVSLDNTQLAMSEPMDESKQREIHGMGVEVATSVHMDEVEDASVSDVIIPPNGLSKARPSFIPRSIDQSRFEFSSPNVIESVSGLNRKVDHRVTILKAVPIESSELDTKVTHAGSPLRRHTILQEENIIEDDPFLTVPQVETKTPPRKTIYEARMNQSPVERGTSQTTPMKLMEPVNIDFPELVFKDNSFGLDLVDSSETQKQETKRPKILRIESRNFMFGLNTAGTAKAESKGNLNHIDDVSISVDSPDPKPVTEPSRKTINAVADVSLDISVLNDVKKDPRKTEFFREDVTMESPPTEKSLCNRSNVFTNENLNESHQTSLIEAPKSSRKTILINENLNLSRLEPRSGSLEDLRNYGQSRRTVKRQEAMDCVVSNSPIEIQSNSTCRTELFIRDADEPLVCDVDQGLANAIENMNVCATHSPLAAEVLLEIKNQRETISFNTDMDQSGCIRKPCLEQLSQKQVSRQTIISRESMDQTLIDECALTVPEFELPVQGTTVICETGINESFASLSGDRQITPEIQKLRFTTHNQAAMDETHWNTGTISEQPVHQTLRLSSLVVDNMDQESYTEQQSSRHLSKENDMNESATNKCIIIEETIRQSPIHRNNYFEHSEAEASFPISRHTNCAVVNINDTVSPTQKLEATLLELSKIVEKLSMQKSRNTDHQQAAMDETQFEIPRQSKCDNKPLVHETIDLTTSPHQTIVHTLSTKSRLAVLAERTIDSTIPQEEPMQATRMYLPTRCTTYQQDSMEETTVALVDNIPKTNKTPNGFKLRRTDSCEQDMDQTVSALRRVSTVEIDDTGGAADVETVTVQSDDRRSDVCKTGTIVSDVTSMGPMDVSVIKFASVSTESALNSRRTIIQPVNIAEDPVKCKLKIEQMQSTLEEESPPYAMEQEHPNRSEFSFVVPQLPDDCVLRSAADRSIQPLKAAPKISQPECVTDSITEASLPTRRISPLADLSELTEKLDLTYGSYRRPTIPSGNLSIVLKEVPEPLMFQPALPVSLMQETPKKTSMIPVRKYRGSIFDRLSMDLDESGILPIVGQEQVSESESEEDRDLKITDVVKNDALCPPVPVEAKVIVKNEAVNESSDDEFFDAVPGGSASFDEPEEEIVCVNRASMARSSTKGRGKLKFINDNDQATAGSKTLKCIDVNDLERTELSKSKRRSSRISKSVLQQDDPLNASLTADYPTKKRKTKIPTPVSNAKLRSTIRSSRRVTFQPNIEEKADQCPDVEAIMIKHELPSICHNDTNEPSKFGQTLLTDPSVFVIEESDMLANESNISLVKSPDCENINRESTLKLNNTYNHDYVNLTLHIDENASCIIIISDDSGPDPTDSKSVDTKAQKKKRLTLEDLPRRINVTRESLVFNSTVASEVMYELKQKMFKESKGCCSFKGNCSCRNRRALAVVKRDNVEALHKTWNQNFNRILESVSDVPSQDVALDIRICEVLNRPMKPLPLPCLEKNKLHLPEIPSIWFLCENYMRSLRISDTPNKVYNLCDLPATPSVTELINNKLETEGYRWFLDVSGQSKMHLYLRHRILRSVRFELQLQKTKRWYSKKEDISIVQIRCVINRNDLVRSPRLFVAHLEFVRAMDKILVDNLCSRYPTTAYMMRLIEHLDTIVEPIFSKVDQLYQIVRNNGAILEQLENDDALEIHKYFEYQQNGTIHWNRITIHFNSMDRIDHHSVLFHRKMINAECLFPTEHQCGRGDIQGLIFLECLLWNVENISSG